jgi:nitrite reductase/ring-hydroxylating ferredoxin subunit
VQDYWRLRPRAPRPGTVLGPLSEIAEGHAHEYIFGAGPSAFRMFVLRKQGDEVVSYLNLCPHFSLPLNRSDGDFLCPEGNAIRCNQHFALFRIDDGVCFSGACEGERLDPIPVEVVDGILRIRP